MQGVATAGKIQIRITRKRFLCDYYILFSFMEKTLKSFYFQKNNYPITGSADRYNDSHSSSTGLRVWASCGAVSDIPVNFVSPGTRRAMGDTVRQWPGAHCIRSDYHHRGRRALPGKKILKLVVIWTRMPPRPPSQGLAGGLRVRLSGLGAPGL